MRRGFGNEAKNTVLSLCGGEQVPMSLSVTASPRRDGYALRWQSQYPDAELVCVLVREGLVLSQLPADGLLVPG